MTTTPAYIAPEAKVEGRRFQRTGIPAGMRLSYFTAAELAEMLGPEGTYWGFSGHTRSGRPLFTRQRFVAGQDGSLGLYSPEGSKVLVHPADRKVGVLAR